MAAGLAPMAVDLLQKLVDVNQNVYTQSPVESRLAAVNQLEKSLLVILILSRPIPTHTASRSVNYSLSKKR